VAIYARVSSDQQAERHTIDSQLSDLKARASGDGHCVRDDMLFVDNGHSGTGLVRSALERLRDMVALSAVDVAYVHAPDRLSRSHAHQVLPLVEFARAGTRVVFLNRPIGGSPEDNLLLQCRGCSRSTSGPRCRSAAVAASGTAPGRAPSASSPARPTATATSRARRAGEPRATTSTRTPPAWFARSSPGWATSA
jgi:Resolvase, N terminal domain